MTQPKTNIIKTNIDIYPLPFEVPDKVMCHKGDTVISLPTKELDRDVLQKLVDKLGKQIMAKAGYAKPATGGICGKKGVFE